METQDFDVAVDLLRQNLTRGWRSRLTRASAAELAERTQNMVRIANHLCMFGTVETHAGTLAKALELAKPVRDARPDLVPLLTKAQLKWFDGPLKQADEAAVRLAERPAMLAREGLANAAAVTFYRSAAKLDQERMDTLGDAISTAFDGAPPEDAETILELVLKERRKMGDRVTREYLLALAIGRFGHEFDFGKVADRPSGKTSRARPGRKASDNPFLKLGKPAKAKPAKKVRKAPKKPKKST